MRYKLPFFSIIFFFFSFGYAQINPVGIPFVSNYHIKEYKAGTENWAVIKDKRGILYFGNSDGVLEYDGVSWNLIKLNKKAVVRSLATDSAGIIYVGAENEFGYLKPDISGKYVYYSLSDSLNENVKNFSEINSLFVINGSVYFCSKRRIYKYKNKTIKIIPLRKGGFVSFYVNNTLYNGDYYEGLLKIENDSAINCKGGNFYIEKDILGIIPYTENKLLISTGEHTLYIYDIQTGKSAKPDFPAFKKLENTLQSSELYVNSVKKTNFGFLISTLWNGVFLTDNKFEIIGHFNKKTGMQDETVISSFYDNKNIIEPTWFGLYNGISKIEINNPLSKVPDDYGLSEDVNDIINYKNELYFAASDGVYKLNFKASENQHHFEIIKETSQNQCWAFNIIDNQLIASGYFLYNLSESPVSVTEFNNHVYKIVSYKNSYFAASTTGLKELSFNGKTFTKKQTVKNIKNEIIDIEKDLNGNLWLLSNNNDLIKFRIENKDTLTEFYNSDKRIIGNKNIYLFEYSGKFLISLDNKLLTYKNNKLTEENTFDQKLHDALININYFISDSKGNIYVSKNHDSFDKIIKINNKASETCIIDSLTFMRLPKMKTRVIYPDDSGLLWICSSEGIFLYNTNKNIDYSGSFPVLIRKVINKDTVLFNGNYFENENAEIRQPKSFIPILSYKNNSLIFYYSAPFFTEEKETRYYTMLTGFENNWSKPSKITFKEYTNLQEGDYVFKVKAKNIYGIESTVAEYRFTVLPPWYRTIWAYLGYILIGIFIIFIIVKLYTRKLIKDKERLEGIVKERTAEIVQQKEEIQAIADNLQEANHEISQKNKTLRKQKEEIEEKNQHITDSISYASRIQQALLPPEEIIQKHLPDYFILFKPRDIVSGDFYWFKQIGNHTVYAAADCTGHGVPGAFMSMLGISFLNEIVTKTRFDKPSDILDKLRKKVKTSLRQTGKDNESKDGMDIALCVIDNDSLTLQYSGAYNPVYIVRKGELIEIKATRNPIGIYLREKPFENHKFQLEKGDMIYTFSDGYVDQFGGENASKFKSKKFKQLLLEIYKKPVEEQKNILNGVIMKWQGELEQTDDIVIFGVRI